MIENLKNEILRASNELNSTRLTYAENFWFGFHSHSLRINNIELFGNFEIKSGWNGIGEKELNELEKAGFLIKISEIVDANDPLERTIEYEIIQSA